MENLIGNTLKPYIGVTGVTTREQAEVLTTFVPENARHALMLGVLVSDKTLRGERNKHPHQFPPVHEISGIFNGARQNTVNLIHFHTDNPRTLDYSLEKLVDLGGPNLHGFQINMPWPNPELLYTFKAMNPTMRMVLQIGGVAMEQVSHQVLQLRDQVNQYMNLIQMQVIDDILLNPSGGLGIPFDPKGAHAYLSDLDYTYPQRLGLGVAGGLGSNSLYLLDTLIPDFPNLSIDAQGQLRNRDTDQLDFDKAGAYLVMAYQAFGELRNF
jgi:hypothetical protein